MWMALLCQKREVKQIGLGLPHAADKAHCCEATVCMVINHLLIWIREYVHRYLFLILAISSITDDPPLIPHIVRNVNYLYQLLLATVSFSRCHPMHSIYCLL